MRPSVAALAVLAVLALAACGTVHGHAQPRPVPGWAAVP